MWINMASFTPLESFIGGLLIGGASLVLILFCGKVMGISGIVGGLVSKSPDWLWRLCFIVGVMIAPWVYQWVMSDAPKVNIEASWWMIIAAGLLVGFGSRMGSGCTSGHSVCGLSRFSLRSLIFTLIFMAVAMTTVFIVQWLR